MKIKISNIKIPVENKEDLRQIICKKMRIPSSQIVDFKIFRLAIDARKRNQICYDYQVILELKGEHPYLLKNKDITLYEAPQPMQYPKWNKEYRPIVVGLGPAGMFAALYLARCKANPIVIERGSAIDQRKKEVDNFLKNKELNEDSNVQFGEGGAGAFSDGKLTTNAHNEFIAFVLEEFHKHGATEDIVYTSNPHVGTDYLEKVVKNIREEIISLGGEVHFNTTFIDFQKEKDSIKILCNNGLEFKTQHLLLGLGHSARDTIRHLYKKGVPMEAKPFSIGVRIEHLQQKINEIQYGKFAKWLPAASYKGAVHLKDRSVYTFCMCPGGEVMASSSEKGSIVTNGMSQKSRDKVNANAAFLVNINPEDYLKNSPLDGLSYQEKYEKAAFDISKDYKAPCNLIKEFLQGKIAKEPRSVKPSYPHGVVFCDFNRCLPPFVVSAMKEAIPLFDRKMRGFNDPDAVMTGIETRSSSPIRILRNEERESSVAGIYPIGEGAGYAGGITTAAIDGLKTAIQIVER
ncbi:MAG: hypothetical protein MJZ76_00530 [Bacteroidales bacterium]|nr:hypothetical protein [Bacteroidales bacterium]